jgi:hypothetical protein
LRFLQEVDKRTGYRTKQMLIAPILDIGGDLVGVIRSSTRPVPFCGDGRRRAELAQTMAVALRQRQQNTVVKPNMTVGGSMPVLSTAELSATCTARRKGIDIEEVLIDEFQVSAAALGNACPASSGLLTSHTRRIAPPADLLKNLKRNMESSHWIRSRDPGGLVILTTDPERIEASRVVSNISQNRLVYKVRSARIQATLDLFYGGGASDATGGFAVDESFDG